MPTVRSLERVLAGSPGGLDETHALQPLDQSRGVHGETPAAHDLFERVDVRAGRRKPVVSSARERAREHQPDVGRDVATIALEHRDVGVADLHQHVHLARTGKERTRDQELGEHDGRGELIALGVELAPGDLLGGHVPELALELPLVGATVELGRSRDAEIAELHRAAAADQDVAGRHVAMDEPERTALFVGGFVRVREPATDRKRDLQRDLGGNRLSSCPRPREPLWPRWSLRRAPSPCRALTASSPKSKT